MSSVIHTFRFWPGNQVCLSSKCNIFVLKLDGRVVLFTVSGALKSGGDRAGGLLHRCRSMTGQSDQG